MYELSEWRHLRKIVSHLKPIEKAGSPQKILGGATTSAALLR
jgi:hypothetical protein